MTAIGHATHVHVNRTASFYKDTSTLSFDWLSVGCAGEAWEKAPSQLPTSAQMMVNDFRLQAQSV